MARSEIFKHYMQIGELLGRLFPDVLEVIVHDFSDLDHSIIFIVNEHISGRKIGDGATELALRRLLEEEKIPDLLVNYRNRGPRGNYLKSASLAIRDESGKMIGAFCLNFDVSLFEQLRHFLERFSLGDVHALVGEGELTPIATVEEDIDLHIRIYLSQHRLQFMQLSYTDKQKIVAYLEQKRCFRQKGSMTAVAKALQLTRQSIYNYIKAAQEKGK